MAVQSKDDLKFYFETGKRPTQQEFADLIDSMVSIDPGTDNIGIGTSTPDAPLHVDGGTEADLTESSGYLIVGDSSGAHIAIDDNEIMAKSDGITAGNLMLQEEGGNILIGSSGSRVTLDLHGDIVLRNGTYANRIETDTNGDLVFYADDLSTVGMRFNPDIYLADDTTPNINGGVLQIYRSTSSLGGAEPPYYLPAPPPADYAEFFESESGKAIPTAIAVAVGDQGKIHPAQKGEIPIGIVSANPLIVGNNPMEWPGKYLRDELGQVIMETYEETETATEIREEKGSGKPGRKIKKQRPKLNPEYDETREYIPRKDREEWCCIGLLGQIALRKGQPVAPSWVKLHEISDKADMWLVK